MHRDDQRISEVELTEDALIVSLMDGRTISVPLVWYARLLNATPKQRRNWQIAGGGYGIYRPRHRRGFEYGRLIARRPRTAQLLKKPGGNKTKIFPRPIPQ
jgi:hypothetical protein